MRDRLVFVVVLPAFALGPLRPSAVADDKDFAGVAFLQKHCLHCHGEKAPKAGLALHRFRDEASVLRGRRTWEDVLEKVRSGEMPPKGRPRPPAAEVDSFVGVVEGLFARADRQARPDPGRVTVRRLNRTEYNNTIRDLVGVDFQPAEDFPSDDVGHGFDNIGDVLTVSPVLLERYLAAAEGILQRAIVVGGPPAPPRRPVAAQFLLPHPKEREPRFRTLKDRDELFTVYRLSAAGQYRLRLRGWGQQAGDEPPKAALLLDGREVHSAAVTAVQGKPGEYESAVLNLTPGEHRAVIRLVNPFSDSKSSDKEKASRTLSVQRLELEGPLDTYPASHKRLMACTPRRPRREQTREILARFAGRAYRRQAADAEVERLVQIADAAQARGDKWEAGIQLAMQAVLVSPKFLFRLELDDRPDSPEPHPLDEYQLACRLSYFLWSSMPDDELFALAGKNALAANLEAQVRRMLRDDRARALVDNFALQWLQLRRLKVAAPDPRMFPGFNEKLRAAMLEETRLFVGAVFREDRSVLDLIDADFTFLNEPLAHLYGIADTNGNPAGHKPVRPGGEPISGEQFRRVSLADGQRGGLLTQASVLTVTSNPTRTSPVKRGRWVLEQILGTPPPPPPPDVPELPDNAKAALSGSLRQRMEQHRAKASCANCHTRMDALGFAFENFDAIGAFRTRDGDFPIDPSGALPGGRSFRGPADLKAILKEKKDLFGRCLAEKLLTYALGRGLEYYDRPAVDRIVAALGRDGYKFSTLVLEITRSDPFRLRRGKDEVK
jgi:hypothetical protein